MTSVVRAHSVSSVLFDYFRTANGAATMLRAAEVGVKTFTLAAGSKIAETVASGISGARKWLSLPKLPEGCAQTVEKIRLFIKTPNWTSGVAVVYALARLLKPVSDTFQLFACLFWSVGGPGFKRLVTGLKIGEAVALIFTSLHDGKQVVAAFSKDKVLCALKIAKVAALIFTAICGLIMISTVIPLSPWLMLGALAGTVVTELAVHCYEKLYLSKP